MDIYLLTYLIKLDIKLWLRTSFYKFNNIKFVWILCPLYLYVIYRIFHFNFSLVSLTVSFFLIGILSYHTNKEGGFIRSSYLTPFLINKWKSFFYGVLSEIILKIIIVLPFLIQIGYESFTLFCYAFLLNFIYILIVYLIAELSLLNKVFSVIHILISTLPIAFVVFLGIHQIDPANDHSVILLLSNHVYTILNISLLILIILLTLLFFMFNKMYFILIYN